MPYIYQEYPRTLHGADGATCTVRTDEEKAQKLADGWCLHPDDVGKRAPVAEPVADLVEEAPKPRGRKPKATVN